MAENFNDVLTEAVRDLAEHGYDSVSRVAYWARRLRDAAEAYMPDLSVLEQMLRDSLRATYTRLIDNGQVVKYHHGIGRFTIDRIKPQLRAELDRRIMAAAGLIKLNREQAVQKTLQRFAGWSTSIPLGGSETIDRVGIKVDLRKRLAEEKFIERRVLIDQGHKLIASINEIIAQDGGAIAGIWHSHWRQPGYNYREDHKERDLKVYALRNNWAFEKGLAKVGPDGYYDKITAAAEEPFCRCYVTWLYALRSLPTDMLTKKGEAELMRLRAEIGAI